MIKIIFLVFFLLSILPANAQEARVYRQNDKMGLLNAENKAVTKPIYDYIVPGIPYSIVKRYIPSTARFETGCVNASGQVIIPLAYADLKIEGLRIIACQKNHHGFVYGLLSIDNTVIIPIVYKSIKALGTLRFAVENEKKKIALFTENGKALTDFTIDTIYPFKKEYCVFEQNGLMGLLDRDGSVKISAQYRDIMIDVDGAIHAKKPNEWQWVDSKNKVLQSFQTDSVTRFSSSTYLIKNRLGYTLIDNNLHQQIPYFKQLFNITVDNILIVKNTRTGVIDLKGNTLIPENFDSVLVDSNYIYALNQKGWLVYSLSGKLLIEKGYEQLIANSNFTYVKRNGFWGALNNIGKEVLACVYDSIYESNAQQVAVGFRGKYGIISPTEEWLVVPQLLFIKLVNEKCYLLQENSLLTLKNFSHTTLYFTNNPLTVTENGLIEKTSWGELWHVSFTGIVTKLQLSPEQRVKTIAVESEGYRAIQKDDKWGFVDAQGRLRIPNRYNGVQNFSEGLAAFSLRKKWGFLNHEDEIIIQPAYEEVGDFINGLSIVKQKGHYGILAKQGKIVLPCRYQVIQKITSGYFQLKNENLYGLADAKGILQYEPKYTSQEVAGSYLIVSRNKKHGVIDFNNNDILPMMYDFIDSTTQTDSFLTMMVGKIESLKF
jgi:hypothetical protein